MAFDFSKFFKVDRGPPNDFSEKRALEHKLVRLSRKGNSRNVELLSIMQMQVEEGWRLGYNICCGISRRLRPLAVILGDRLAALAKHPSL
jgi:hypothetical protein